MSSNQEAVSKPKSVASSASLMGLATLCSRFLGLAREQVFAYLFGASNAADAFNIAFRIPNLLRDLFAEGAMSAAFVPNFTRELASSKEAAFKLLSAVLSVLFVGLSILSLVGMFFSPELVNLYAGSYRDVAGKLELTTALTRMMFPFFPMVAMAAVTMGALNALGSFFLPAFAPVLFNVASVLCGLILTPIFANYTSMPPIYSMGVGVVLGGFLQFYVQWWQIKRAGLKIKSFKQEFLHPWSVPGVRKVLWLLIPGTVGLAATQLGIFINSIYATGQGSGAVSWLNYAFRLMQFPIGIFGVSLAAATLPAVSRKLVANDRAGAAKEVSNSLKLTMAINGPATAGLMIAGLPIIQFIFQHGQFGSQDSLQTANALYWYALGLVGYSAVKVLVPVFYALGTTRIPVIVSFVSVIMNAALNHIFLDILHFQFWALAAATSITATLNAIALSVFLHRMLPGAINLDLMKSLGLHSILSGFSGFLAFLALGIVGKFEPEPGAMRIAFWGSEVAVALIVAIASWLILGKFLKIAEIEQVFGIVRRRLKKT